MNIGKNIFLCMIILEFHKRVLVMIILTWERAVLSRPAGACEFVSC